MNEDYNKALEVFKQGGVVVYPTDTVYGIGSRIDREESIKRVFAAKKRPLDKPLTILAGSLKMAFKLYRSPIPNIVRQYMENYWPGGLTVVYFKSGIVNPLISAGKMTVGVRLPKYQELTEMIDKLGVGILGPSANLHGEKPAGSYQKLSREIIRSADYIIRGKPGGGKSSTVADLSGGSVQIIRQGAVSLTDL